MTSPIKYSQCKKCRRAGEKLFLKGDRCNSAKCAMVKRNFPPGFHGAGRPKKLTTYGRQLLEKQKAKRIYGLGEKQFRKYYQTAIKRVGNTGELLFEILESRLDNTVYRLGFAQSRNKARQLVGHDHIKVNGKKVNISSYSIKIGDIITIREKSLKSPLFVDLGETLSNQDFSIPWLSVDAKNLEGKVTSKPKTGDVAINIDWQVIIEFYSR